MRSFLKLVLLLILIVPVAVAGALFLAIDKHPAVDRLAEITPQNIERAKRILDENDPRKLQSGARRTISLRQADVDLAANYLAHRYARGSARVMLRGGSAQIDASAQLPENPIGRFLNVVAVLVQGETLPRIEHFQIGGVPIPRWMIDVSLARISNAILGEESYQAVLDAVKKINFSNEVVSVTYEWQSELPDKLRNVLVRPAEQERLRAYHRGLGELSRSVRSKNISLAELLVPLFTLAAERSYSADPVAENRAAILVLTLYVNGQPLAAIIPEAKDWPQPLPHDVTLNSRDDFPKHFIISAALAAHAGTPLSDAVGVYKEIADSRGGSGFSFNDIAANRAGTRFGEWAESRGSAKTLQQRLAAGIRERDIMPVTKDLPEFMPESEFVRLYGGVDAPAYKRMMAEIERRITTLPLYR